MHVIFSSYITYFLFIYFIHLRICEENLWCANLIAYLHATKSKYANSTSANTATCIAHLR